MYCYKHQIHIKRTTCKAFLITSLNISEAKYGTGPHPQNYDINTLQHYRGSFFQFSLYAIEPEYMTTTLWDDLEDLKLVKFCLAEIAACK